MRTHWLIIASLLLYAGTINSQSNRAYCAQEITWFGIDYSQAYFIDDKAFPDPSKLTDKLFYEWNNFVFKEPKKFNIEKAFNKRNVLYSTSYINNRNTEIDINKRVGNFWFQEGYLNNDSIQEIISSYKLPKHNSGVGLVFIVMSLDKPQRIAEYWVTFFDIESKEILLTRQINGAPGGAGIRNYWANSFYNALVKAEREMGFVY